MNIKPCFNAVREGEDWRIEITAKAESATDGEIMIYGTIADRKWYDDDGTVIPKDFDKALKSLGSNLKNLFIRVHSYGGSVFAGQAIVTMIDTARQRGVKVTAKIDGIGASMGSVIPQAADRLIMAENAMMMIHKPSAMAWGNANDMRDTADMLDKAESQLHTLYMRRFKGTQDELSELIKGKVDGTWLTADEALEWGLIDEIDEPVEMAACAGGYRMNGLVFPTDALAGATDKIQIFNTAGGEKEMLYDKELDAKIKAALDDGKTIAKNGDCIVIFEPTQATATAEFLTAEQVQGAGLTDISGEIVLAGLKDLADAGIDINAVAAGLAKFKEPDPALTAKAAKYDAMFTAEVAEALKNGVRAKGADFKAERWEKILNGLDLEEVRAQSEEWLAEGERAMNAGQRLSRTPTGEPAATLPDELFKV